MTLVPVVVALGSNLGDRRRNLRAALSAISRSFSLVRISGLYETDPVDSPPGSPLFLNAVAAGYTSLSSPGVMTVLHQVEASMGRRRAVRNAPRIIDLDLILYGAALSDREPLLPHPRFREREFVLAPLREFALPWIDPLSGRALADLHGSGGVRKMGPLL